MRQIHELFDTAMFIVEELTKLGYEAYLVGGCVRDVLLNCPPKDVDIATNCPMEILEERFETHDIGQNKKFGIVVVRLNGFTLEIAQFRSEDGYSDGRRPDSVCFNASIQEDVTRRDFRFNALCIDVNGQIVDHVNGIDDLNNRVLRTVGNPAERFSEDYLRLLRAIRFTSRLQFELDEEVKQAITDNASNVKALPMERIHQELVKMASVPGPQFADAVKLMDATGLLGEILPEVKRLQECQEQKKFHPEAYLFGTGTTFDHTMVALSTYKGSDPLINLAILFHDLGKFPARRQKDDGVNYTYCGHDHAGLRVIDSLCRRLKFSLDEAELFKFVCANHMNMHWLLKMKPAKVLRVVSSEFWEALVIVSRCDDSCRGDDVFDREAFDAKVKYAEEVKKNWCTNSKPKKIVDGNRVTELTGIPSSKKLGDIVKSVTAFCIDNNITEPEEIDKLIVAEAEKLANV